MLINGQRIDKCITNVIDEAVGQWRKRATTKAECTTTLNI